MIYQMKDATDRVVGVVDETGAVISCSELNLIGEVREGFMAERQMCIRDRLTSSSPSLTPTRMLWNSTQT